MDSYLAFKQEHKLLTKRDRLMRTAWKHGVVGVDDADSATTSIFYLEAEKQRQKELAEKEFINKRRQKGK